MSLAYTKTDGGDYWIYRARFKKWQLLLIVIVPILVGSFPFSLSAVIRIALILFGLIFSFIYGMSAVPASLAFRRALKEGKRIVVDNKDGYDQYSIRK